MAQQELAKKRAEAVTSNPQLAGNLPPAYELPLERLSVIGEVRRITEESLQDADPEAPYCIDSSKEVEVWTARTPVKQLFLEFEKSYKKTTGFLDHNRHTDKVSPSNLKFLSATKALFESLAPPNPVDVSSVSRTVESGQFVTGLAPRATWAGVTPNGVGMLRVMHMGSISVMLMPMASLVEAAGSALSPSSGLQRYLENLTINQIEDLATKNVQILWCTLGPSSLLYVPMGWAVIEKVVSGQIITHLRKAVVYKSQKLHDNGVASLPFFPHKDQAKVAELMKLAL